jgi:hypothetical protein
LFGFGMLFHAISALCVFSLGFVSFASFSRHICQDVSNLGISFRDRSSTFMPRHSSSTSSLAHSSISTGSWTRST